MASRDETKIRAQLISLKYLAKHFQILTESRMTDFFLKDYYSKIPQCWRNQLLEIKLEDLGDFINLNKPISGNIVWPLSLLSLRKVIEENTLPRPQRSDPLRTEGYLNSNETPTKTVCFVCDRLKYTFSKHVKPKKRYEIEEIGLEIAKVAVKSGARTVIDIGSGLGHLCRVLGYGYGLNAIGVETQGDLIKRARDWDQELEKEAGKVLNEMDFTSTKACRPHHLLKNISFQTTPNDFTEIIEKYSGEESGNFGIVGLHPCGNLAPILLKLFSECKKAKFLVLASCCYHRMYLDSQEPGFPLSRFLAPEKCFLGYEAASWACHSIESSSKRLSSGDYEFLKIHCFRATLEEIISQEWPEHMHKSLNNVPHSPDLTFQKYCEKALKKLGVIVPENRLSSSQVRKNLSQWKEVVLYHALCLLMAPVTETIFQLDRLLYLKEKGIPGQLHAAFNPEVSPRNYVLTAIKPE